MLICVSEHLRRCARGIKEGQQGESPYINIPYYQTRMDPSDTQQTVQMGPPSMYNDTDKKDKLKNVEDMRRQGPRPGPIEPLTRIVLPVTVTVLDDPKTDEQGERSNNTKPRGDTEDLNRDTIGFNPGEWEREDVGFSREQRAQYRDTQQNKAP